MTEKRKMAEFLEVGVSIENKLKKLDFRPRFTGSLHL